MNNLWTENKYINYSIDIMIVFMSMNFLHYGQLFLPIICLLLFISNKCKFKVNNLYTFIILCLFGICFLVFSYNLGFYCVMGFCLPMAYYIGSNLNNKSEEAIKKVIYLIIIGMFIHYFLNFIYELYMFGWHRTMVKSTRYDVWLKDAFVSTGTATNSVIILSIIYFLSIKEKNNKYKIIGLIIFAFSLFYTVVLRRRTQLGILIITFVLSLILDLIVNKHNNINNKKIKKILFVIISIFVATIVAYVFNIFGFKNYINNNSVIAFIKKEGMSSGRISIFLNGLKYVPTYLWGGQKISSIVGMPFHDLLFNIYDYAGIITTLLMMTYLVLAAKNIYKVLKEPNITKDFKLLIIEIMVGYIIMFFMEPLMTGSSIFLICGIIIQSCIERISL